LVPKCLVDCLARHDTSSIPDCRRSYASFSLRNCIFHRFLFLDGSVCVCESENGLRDLPAMRQVPPCLRQLQSILEKLLALRPSEMEMMSREILHPRNHAGDGDRPCRGWWVDRRDIADELRREQLNPPKN